MARYQITYANAGRIPDVFGEFHAFMDAELGPMPTILDDANHAFVLDPRAIVRDESGHIVYTPRDYPLDTHTKAMREWLLSHPKWGRRPA